MRERSTRRGRAYAAIPNAAMRDRSISIEARGLLALLMTYSDDWEFKKDHLMAESGMGRDKFERAMSELRQAQYVDLVFHRDTKGRVAGTTWVIRDDGNRGPEKPGVGEATEALKNRGPDKPTPGESAPIRRTTLQEEQKEETQTLFGALGTPNLPAIIPQPAPDLFAEFWEAYPKCPRKTDRPKAKALFDRITAGKHNAISKTDAQTIIAAMQRYASTNPDPQYVPLPTTWLNRERWMQFQTEEQAEDPEIATQRARLRAITENAMAASHQRN